MIRRRRWGPRARRPTSSAYDLGTLDQAREGFETHDLRGVLVSGSHRCASDTPSACDGTTTVCGGGDQPYPISDPAHEVASSFHALHRGLTEAEPDLRVASLHGTSQDGASVSDGTDLAGRAGTFAARFTLALASAFPAEPVTTCNAFPGATHEVRLCGTTNVQGRHLNGSPEAP
ncbi:MAG: hypothetical protein P1V51_11925 [Deltaproteobacteria bacterium]|nr:hypothetical protein [Deltaproteobacteria bacterium]